MVFMSYECWASDQTPKAAQAGIGSPLSAKAHPQMPPRNLTFEDRRTITNWSRFSLTSSGRLAVNC